MAACNAIQLQVFVWLSSIFFNLFLKIIFLLGIIAGLLLGLILFRVLQIKLENQRLNKELTQTRDKLMHTQHSLEQHLAQKMDQGLPLNVNVNGKSNTALPPIH